MFDIEATVRRYFGDPAADAHPRYRSWEHCYRHFNSVGREGLAAQPELAALNLGFYLASWGMYRGSSFLLQFDYTAHLPAIDCLSDATWDNLRSPEAIATMSSETYVETVFNLYGCLHKSYEPFGRPTDTLLTKILIGTFACVPAVDRFFIAGWCGSGRAYSYLNRPFLSRVREFAVENTATLEASADFARHRTGTPYPAMKLVDMYFFELGFEADVAGAMSGGATAVVD